MATNARIEEALQIGEKNRQTAELVRNWCAHVSIKKMGGVGMVEQMSGLPIGPHALQCPHAAGGGMGTWDLVDATLDFYDRNCVDCKFRQPVGLPNISTLIAARDERQKQQRLEQDRVEKIKADALAARDAKRKLIRAGLEAVPATVLDLVSDLDHQRSKEAGEKLVQTAGLAAESFKPPIIEHLFDLVEAKEFGIIEPALSALTQLPVDKKRLANAALQNLFATRDVAAKIIEQYGEYGDDALIATALPSLISLASPERYRFQHDEPEPNIGPLSELYRTRPDWVRNGLKILLGRTEAHNAGLAARGIKILSAQDPSLLQFANDDLIAKLARAKWLTQGSEDEVSDALRDIRNMLVEAFDAAPQAIDSYAAANNLNQYPSVTTGGIYPLGYDANGNLTSGNIGLSGSGSWGFTYDPENRLMTACMPSLGAGGSCPSPTVSASYAYDPLGRRTHKSGTGVTETYFLDDGDDEIAEYSSTGTLTRRFVPGPAINEPIAMVTVSTGLAEYYHTDHHGSVVATSRGDNGNIRQGPVLYDAYGNCFVGAAACTTLGATANPFLYTGMYLDQETGLFYDRARYYSSALGRFAQTDPVGYKNDLNLYTYVGNDPLNHIDPTGVASIDCSGGLGTSNCSAGTILQNGDSVRTRFGTLTISHDRGFTIATRVSQGNNGQMTDRQVTAVVFNETRSLSGAASAQARSDVANAVINGDESLGTRRPITAPDTANVPAGERQTYIDSQQAVMNARSQRELGYDPTAGAIHFNLRPNDSTRDFQRHELRTQAGPLNNSYPTDTLPATDIYVNTYQ